MKLLSLHKLINKYFIVLIFSLLYFFSAYSQTNLPEKQIVKGFVYLKNNRGYRNPSTVQYISHICPDYNFDNDCFSAVKYQISAQNGFGGYDRESIEVFFYHGQPFYIMTKDNNYYMYNRNLILPQLVQNAITLNGFSFIRCKKEMDKRAKIEQNKINEEKALRVKQQFEDKRILKEIDSLIDIKEYFNAKNLISQLNIPNPELINRINQIDKTNQNTIIEFLNKRELSDALELYNLLLDKNEKIKELFVASYTEKYKDSTIFLDQEKANYYLKKYFLNKLDSHTADNYRLQISTEGVLKITNKSLNVIHTSNLDKSDIILIQKDEFMFPVKCEYSYNVISTNSLIKLKKHNGTLIYDEYIKDSEKSRIDKLLKDGLIGRYTIKYQRKDFNSTLYVDTASLIDYKGIGGPSNMFKSILVPGWGVRAVTGGEKSGLPRTILTYGLLTSALVFQTMSVLDYQNYLNATSQDEITKYYTSANSNNSTSYYLAAAGLAVWIYDIVWVAKKGFDNKSEQKAFKRNLSFHFEPTIQSLAFSYKLKF